MSSVVFFDIGDTLAYRERSRIDADVDYFCMITGLKKGIVRHFLYELSLEQRWLYDYSTPVRGEDIIDLHLESSAYKCIIRSLYERLNYVTDDANLDRIVDKRYDHMGYKLRDGVVDLLETLKTRGTSLGIFTNGRPSRRRILRDFGILDYFDDNLIYISDELGVSKKDISMYRLAGDAKNVLVDDEHCYRNLARSVGWEVYPSIKELSEAANK